MEKQKVRELSFVQVTHAVNTELGGAPGVHKAAQKLLSADGHREGVGLSIRTSELVADLSTD